MSEWLDRVRATALELPGTEERLSHGQPGFFVAGKQFVQLCESGHGDGRLLVCVRTSGTDEQAMLVDADPQTYSRPPDPGPSGWVGIDLAAGTLDWDQVGDRIARSWELAAPRGLLEAGGR